MKKKEWIQFKDFSIINIFSLDFVVRMSFKPLTYTHMIKGFNREDDFQKWSKARLFAEY